MAAIDIFWLLTVRPVLTVVIARPFRSDRQRGAREVCPSAEMAPDACVSSRFFLSEIGQMYSRLGFDSIAALNWIRFYCGT